MFRDLTRAQQRLLHLTGPLQSRPDSEVDLPTSVIFTPEAAEALRVQVYATGDLRGGPLFGSSLEGEVTVVAAVPNGVLFKDDTLLNDPLRLDPSYVLGWSESLTQRYEGRVDWIGNWMMRANGRLGPVEQELVWFRRGLVTDLFNERYFLAWLGWSEAGLDGRVYTYDRDAAAITAFNIRL